MSGYPQGPYGGPQGIPPGQMPPGQFPPGQYPTGAGQPGMTMPPRTSAAAVTSLVMSLVFCIPVIHSLGAILFGVIGISATGKPNVRGRGMAITGLLIGLLGIVVWPLCGLGLWKAWQTTEPERKTTLAFVTDLSTGNLADAAAISEPGTDPRSIKASSDLLQPLGPITHANLVGFNVVANSGSDTVVSVTYMVQFGSQNKSVVVTLVRHSDGTDRVKSWTIN